MKNPLYKQILKGTFLCVFLLCTLTFILAFIHDLNLQRMDRDNFFRESVLESRLMEQEYLQELALVQSCLPGPERSEKKELTKVQRDIFRTFERLEKVFARGLMGFGLPTAETENNYPTKEELRSFFGADHLQEGQLFSLFEPSEDSSSLRSDFYRLRNSMEKALRTDPQLILFMQRLKRELAAVSELINEDDLELQYFSTKLCALIYNAFGRIDTTGIEEYPLSVFDHKSVVNEAFRNLIIILVLRTFQSEKINSFAGPLCSLLEFNPEKFNAVFFNLRLAMLRFSVYYRGMSLNEERKNFMFPEAEKLVEPFAGYLTVSIRTDRIFERKIKTYASKNEYYSFFTNRGFAEHCNNKQIADKQIFIYDAISGQERLSSFQELSDNFFAFREVLRFRWQHEEGWRYAVVMPDAVFDDYVHLHEVPQDKFIHYRTINNALRLLCFFLLIFLLVFVFAFRRISRPLRMLAECITQTVNDLSDQHIREFLPVFDELYLMQTAFYRMLKQVNHNIFLREALLTIQNLIRDEIGQEIFELMIAGIYRNCFFIEFKSYDYSSDTLIMEELPAVVSKLNRNDNGQAVNDMGRVVNGREPAVIELFDESESGISRVEERKPFDEQLRFYYRKIILEQEFTESLARNREFELARQVQLSLLPGEISDQSDYEISTFYLAARFLGGDFFELIQGMEKSVFLIADVSGKGFGSALFGAAVKSLFRAYYQRGLGLDDVFCRLNNALIAHFHQQLFCTCFAVEKQGSAMTFCSAGHNNMYLARSEEIISLWAVGLPFGLLENCKYKKGYMELLDQDLLFLYTDGCNEAENVDKQLFGDDGVKNCISGHHNFKLSELNKNIYETLLEFTRGVEQSDDITYLLVRVRDFAEKAPDS